VTVGCPRSTWVRVTVVGCLASTPFQKVSNRTFSTFSPTDSPLNRTNDTYRQLNAPSGPPGVPSGAREMSISVTRGTLSDYEAASCRISALRVLRLNLRVCQPKPPVLRAPGLSGTESSGSHRRSSKSVSRHFKAIRRVFGFDPRGFESGSRWFGVSDEVSTPTDDALDRKFTQTYVPDRSRFLELLSRISRKTGQPTQQTRKKVRARMWKCLWHTIGVCPFCRVKHDRRLSGSTFSSLSRVVAGRQGGNFEKGRTTV
jgi:hypothetical protein